MSIDEFLSIQPSDLKFPFELKKQSTCSMQLTNKSDKSIAFKVKTTHPKKYSVRPNAGVVLPHSVCNVTVTMQAQKEAPPDMQCRDKFLVQSIVVPDGVTGKNITPEMFNREERKVINEFKLRVINIPANPPSPVPEGDEEGTSPRTSSVEDDNRKFSLSEAVTRQLEFEGLQSSSETQSMILKLTEEKASVIQQNQKLHEELELIRRQITRSNADGFSMLFVLLVGLLGFMLGYLLRTLRHQTEQ